MSEHGFMLRSGQVTPPQRLAPEGPCRRNNTPTVAQRRSACTISNLNFFYGPKQAVFGLNLKIPDQQGHRAHRPFRLRQIHVSAHSEPHERNDPPHARSKGEVLLDGQDISSMDVVESAPPRRHGLSAAQSVSRNRFSTTSPTACASTATRAASTISSSTACAAPRSGTK